VYCTVLYCTAPLSQLYLEFVEGPLERISKVVGLANACVPYIPYTGIIKRALQ